MRNCVREKKGDPTPCGAAANSPFIQVCVFCLRVSAGKTHKLVLQLVVAAGDPPVRGIPPHSLNCPAPETQNDQYRREQRIIEKLSFTLLMTYHQRKEPLHAQETAPWPGRSTGSRLSCPLAA